MDIYPASHYENVAWLERIGAEQKGIAKKIAELKAEIATLEARDALLDREGEWLSDSLMGDAECFGGCYYEIATDELGWEATLSSPPDYDGYCDELLFTF